MRVTGWHGLFPSWEGLGVGSLGREISVNISRITALPTLNPLPRGDFLTYQQQRIEEQVNTMIKAFKSVLVSLGLIVVTTGVFIGRSEVSAQTSHLFRTYKHEVPQKLSETPEAITAGKKVYEKGVGIVMESKVRVMVLHRKPCFQNPEILREMSIKFVLLHLVQFLQMKTFLELLPAV